MASTKAAPRLENLEHKLDEIAREYEPLEKARQRMKRLKGGSEAYLDTLPEIAVAAEVVKAKLDSLISIIDEIVDAMPDD